MTDVTGFVATDFIAYEFIGVPQDINGNFLMPYRIRRSAGAAAPAHQTHDSNGFPSFTAGVANELCLMFQIKSSNSGNYSTERLSISYDLTLDLTN